MTFWEIINLVSEITYKPGWNIVARREGDRVCVQLSVTNLDDILDAAAKPGQVIRTAWKSGKRYLSEHMCRQEIVGAVFDLIKSAEMHEVHEWFRYKGASIYNPHLDPDVLAEVARKKASFNVREDAMTMGEP